MRALGHDPHLLEREADLPPHVLAAVIRRDVHVARLVVGDHGALALLAGLEEVEFHLRTEAERDAFLPGAADRVFQDASRIAREGFPARFQHVAVHAHDASAVDGFGDEAASDLFLRPDPATLAVLPWRPDHGRVVRMYCDVLLPGGEPFAC
ncbi:MAG: glutamine synthetase, partial [Clostridia bacterium]|nr:glutamine synthetase [Clostridia bacterium]